MNYFKYAGRVKSGDTVKLISTVGKPQMPVGLEGVVEFVDDIGQIHVKWKNGSSLALVPEDKFIVISKNPNEK